MTRFLLSHAIDDGAARHPSRAAVKIGSSEMTYEALALKSNQIANYLLEDGVKKGDRVGIYMNKGLHTIAALYGILKAGGVYVPLDPFAPLTRIAYVIQDCGIRVVLSDDGKRGEIPGLLEQVSEDLRVVGPDLRDTQAAHLITWERLWKDLPTAPPHLAQVEQDLAYILYTSGSTGKPKGIMHTHRSGLSFAEWAAACYGLSMEDRLSNHAPLHFDLSTFDYFAGHIAGATTVIVPEAVSKFPASMSRFIEEQQISVWYSVPFALIQILLRGAVDSHDLSSLRWVLFAGEPFPPKYLRELMAKLPTAEFSNLFGPTETNVCTYYHVPREEPLSDDPLPIGRPCDNVEALVADEKDDEVAKGEVGELLIRGGVVMQGYWGMPERTQSRFLRMEVAPGLVHSFYRTGDLVRASDDGSLHYLGRKDRQIKTRGYRVELDEVELALLSHASVEQAAVYIVPDEEGSHVILAAAVLHEHELVTSKTLLDHMATQLPPYALPVRLDLADTLPRTSTGKVDRVRLAAQVQQSASS